MLFVEVSLVGSQVYGIEMQHFNEPDIFQPFVSSEYEAPKVTDTRNPVW